QDLPLSFQKEALAALGARIPRLPADAQQAAIASFLEHAARLPAPRPPLLDELAQAAASGSPGLARREQSVVDYRGPARAAVQSAQNVQTVTQRYGITDPTE